MDKSPTMTSLVPNKVQNESWPFRLPLLNHQLFPINIFFLLIFNHPLPPPPPTSLHRSYTERQARTPSPFNRHVLQQLFHCQVFIIYLLIVVTKPIIYIICFTDSCLLIVEELNLLYKIQLQYRLSHSPAGHSGGHPVHALH